jgi:hypothetical protein
MNPIVIVAPEPGATAQGSVVQGQPWMNLIVPCEAEGVSDGDGGAMSIPVLQLGW